MRNPHRPTLADRVEQRRESHSRRRGVYRETELRLRGISPNQHRFIQARDLLASAPSIDSLLSEEGRTRLRGFGRRPLTTLPRVPETDGYVDLADCGEVGFRGYTLILSTGEIYINGEIAGPALDVAAMREEREKAEERALALLMRFLSPEQRDTWEGGGYLFTTSSTGRTWRISIDACCLMDGDRPLALYCYVPEDNLPQYDAVLARKLMIEHHEEKVIKDGNLLMYYTEYKDVGGGMYIRRDDQGFTYTPHTQPITRTITRGIDEYAEYATIGHRITEA